MAITPETPGSPAIPNSKTAESVVNPAIPNSTTAESIVNPATPISKTAETVVDAAIPNSLSSEAAVSPATPISKTAQAASAPAIPNSKTSETIVDPAIPVSKTAKAAATIGFQNVLTSESEASPAIPASKTAESVIDPATPISKTAESIVNPAAPNVKNAVNVAAIPRTLTPLVDMHFDSESFASDGNAILFSDLFTYTRATTGTYIGRDVVANKAVFTIKTAAINGLRLEYNPLTGEKLGALLESAGENLAVRSAEFDNASWSKNRSSIDADSTTAPDGTTTADTLIEDSTASDTHIVTQSGISYTSGEAYSLSVFAKAKERSEIVLALGATAFPTDSEATFNLLTGAIINEGSGADSSLIVDLGNGWFRCSITATSDNSTSSNAILRLSVAGSDTYNGDGASGIYIWGAQDEEMFFTTSYIPTPAGSTVTRSADITTIPQAGNIVDDGDLTVFATVDMLGVDDDNAQYIFDASVTTGRVFMQQNNTDDRFRFRRGGAALNSNDDFVANVMVDVAMAFSFSANTAQGYFDKTTSGAAQDATLSLELDGTVIQIGMNNSSTSQLNGHIKRLAFYNSLLTDQEIALL